MKKYVLSFCFLLPLFLNAQHYEDDYVVLIQQHLGGETEVAVQSGYIDLLTSEYAIEVEFANKWKQSIGQALWYSLQTNKTAGIILIKKKASDYKYVIQLGSALEYAKLQDRIRLWIWPDDFNGEPPSGPPPSTSFWLSTSGNKRHNMGCRYYNNTIGRYCEKNEGVTCRVCGG